jgi:hypothetical protein
MGRHVICCMCTCASEGTSASGFKIRGASVDFYSPCEKLEPSAKRRGCVNLVELGAMREVQHCGLRFFFVTLSSVNFSVVC